MNGNEKQSIVIWKATERPKIIVEQIIPHIAAQIFSPPMEAQIPIIIKTSIIAAPIMTMKLQTTVTYD